MKRQQIVILLSVILLFSVFPMVKSLEFENSNNVINSHDNDIITGSFIVPANASYNFYLLAPHLIGSNFIYNFFVEAGLKLFKLDQWQLSEFEGSNYNYPQNYLKIINALCMNQEHCL